MLPHFYRKSPCIYFAKNLTFYFNSSHLNTMLQIEKGTKQSGTIKHKKAHLLKLSKALTTTLLTNEGCSSPRETKKGIKNVGERQRKKRMTEKLSFFFKTWANKRLLPLKIYFLALSLSQGLVKGAELCLNPYFFGWLEKWVGWQYKYSLHVENKSKDFWNKVSLLLQDLGLSGEWSIIHVSDGDVGKWFGTLGLNSADHGPQWLQILHIFPNHRLLLILK